jgi:hypothetical protein
MYIRKIEKFFPSPVTIPAYVMAIAGIVLIFFEWMIAIFVLALAFFIISGNEGIVIDEKNKKFKVYYSVYFIKFGSWEPLPNFGRLLLVPEQLKYKGNIFSKKSLTDEKFGVRLFYANSSDYLLAAKGELEPTKKDAEFLSKMLNLKIEDYSHVNIDEVIEKEQPPPSQ